MASRTFVQAALVAAVLTAGGCGLIEPGPPAEVGDCVQMDSLPDQDVTDVPTVDCSAEHDGQVFTSFVLPDGKFPSEQEWQDVVGERCVGDFRSFVGTAYADSALDIFYLSPTADSWESGDREVLCVAYLPDGTTTETFEGSEL